MRQSVDWPSAAIRISGLIPVSYAGKNFQASESSLAEGNKAERAADRRLTSAICNVTVIPVLSVISDRLHITGFK